MEFAEVVDNTALQLRGMEYKGYGGNRNLMKRIGPMDKRSLICEYCHKSGHNKDTCFKIHGVPDWYKDLNDQRKKADTVNRAYATVEPQPTVDTVGNWGNNLVSDLMEALRLVQNKVPQDPVHVHFATMEETEGMSLTNTKLHESYPRTWIVDSRATSHMCGDVKLFHSITSSHKDFLAALSTIHEPSCYKQAKGCLEWEIAMQQELVALEQNDTWDVLDLPPGKKLIGSKWVYRVKLKANVSVERYKARLVAKGYNQIEGVDYVDHFSHVVKVVTVSTFLVVALGHNWPVHQVDINNAFLHDFFDKDIYLAPLEGSSMPTGKVCKLKRSLHGLKQASRQWNLELTNKFLAFGFMQSQHDHCLFLKDTDNGLFSLLVYVDDILLTNSSEEQISAVKSFLDSAFTIKDLGPAKYFLGLEIDRCDTGLLSAKPTPTPLPTGVKLSVFYSPELSNPKPYRRLVGRLQYLNFTRLDISFRAQQFTQFVHKPCQIHMDVALYLVRYLKGCPDRGLFFPSSSSFGVTAFCDANWLGVLTLIAL
ncbi:UNVERIFIED_CONTAM: Retrovirus-related Pol polyprotein from transposon RE1 [Sesamum radiatum]|uniref:Retrovirus-related Pol polyprotein from transposon RE1 n=1 Tax=Sesamum radiatum TaxID=300843 RepID=A0AAW2WAR4_SESRA